MGRAPCCNKANVKKGAWFPKEDFELKEYIEKYGIGGNRISLPHKVGMVSFVYQWIHTKVKYIGSMFYSLSFFHNFLIVGFNIPCHISIPILGHHHLMKLLEDLCVYPIIIHVVVRMLQVVFQAIDKVFNINIPQLWTWFSLCLGF